MSSLDNDTGHTHARLRLTPLRYSKARPHPKTADAVQPLLVQQLLSQSHRSEVTELASGLLSCCHKAACLCLQVIHFIRHAEGALPPSA